jgi:ubiquinone/menaquinone biosynthesis C-methylase UbiE
MLEIARRRAPGARYVHGDGLSLPFGDRSFERVFSAHFYGHLNDDERATFVAEARRVGEQLVIVDAAVRPNHAPEETQHRLLADGSSWPILKRYFTPERLVAEVGGELLHSGPWFVVVQSPR